MQLANYLLVDATIYLLSMILFDWKKTCYKLNNMQTCLANRAEVLGVKIPGTIPVTSKQKVMIITRYGFTMNDDRTETGSVACK